jgi:hypothetical protein
MWTDDLIRYPRGLSCCRCLGLSKLTVHGCLSSVPLFLPSQARAGNFGGPDLR